MYHNLELRGWFLKWNYVIQIGQDHLKCRYKSLQYCTLSTLIPRSWEKEKKFQTTLWWSSQQDKKKIMRVQCPRGYVKNSFKYNGVINHIKWYWETDMNAEKYQGHYWQEHHGHGENKSLIPWVKKNTGVVKIGVQICLFRSFTVEEAKMIVKGITKEKGWKQSIFQWKL